MGDYSRQRARRKKSIPILRELVVMYKETLGCADCGICEPAILDFHHPNPGSKSEYIKGQKFSITDLANIRGTFEAVFREVRKCIVLCANCHRRREAQKRKTPMARSHVKQNDTLEESEQDWKQSQSPKTTMGIPT